MPTFHVSEMAAGTESMTGENVDELGTQEVPVNQKLTFEGKNMLQRIDTTHNNCKKWGAIIEFKRRQ